MLHAWWQLAQSGDLWIDVQASLQRSLTGFGIALLAGIPLGLLIGWYPLAAELLSPVLVIFLNTAAIALLPVFTLILGIGETSKIAIILYASIWPILYNTISGVRNVDPLLIKSARSLGLSHIRLFQKVILPASVPTIFTGVRLGGAASILVLITTEMVGAKAGLGYLILNSQYNFQIPRHVRRNPDCLRDRRGVQLPAALTRTPLLDLEVRMTRQLHLNAFLMGTGHHEAAWRHPDSRPQDTLDARHYARLAQVAERGKLDSIFFADNLALGRNVRYGTGNHLEPVTLLSAVAMLTERIGLIATASTTYHEPFQLARKFASLDHISNGRAGWNIVTSAGEDEAQNFNLDKRPAHEERYARATEFVEVVQKLWDSWADDARLARQAERALRRPRPRSARSTTSARTSRCAGRSTSRVRCRAIRCWCRRARPRRVASTRRSSPRPSSPRSRRWPTGRRSTPISRPGPRRTADVPTRS